LRHNCARIAPELRQNCAHLDVVELLELLLVELEEGERGAEEDLVLVLEALEVEAVPQPHERLGRQPEDEERDEPLRRHDRQQREHAARLEVRVQRGQTLLHQRDEHLRVDAHAGEAVGVVVGGEQPLHREQEHPERVLLRRHHEEQRRRDEIHALAVAGVQVAPGAVRAEDAAELRLAVGRVGEGAVAREGAADVLFDLLERADQLGPNLGAGRRRRAPHRQQLALAALLLVDALEQPRVVAVVHLARALRRRARQAVPHLRPQLRRHALAHHLLELLLPLRRPRHLLQARVEVLGARQLGPRLPLPRQHLRKRAPGAHQFFVQQAGLGRRAALGVRAPATGGAAEPPCTPRCAPR
jgi:hypothetical protein